MKFIDVDLLPNTLVHQSISRKAILTPGGSSTDIQTVNWVELHPGESVPEHVHDDCEELFVFLAGEGKVIVDGQRVPVQKQSFLLIDPREKHFIQNSGDISLIFLSIRVKTRV